MNGILKIVEIRVGGGDVCIVCGNGWSGGDSCGAQIYDERPNTSRVVDAVYTVTGKKVSDEELDVILSGGTPDRININDFVREIDDEKLSLIELLGSYHGVLERVDMGRCECRTYKHCEGVLIDRHTF